MSYTRLVMVRTGKPVTFEVLDETVVGRSPHLDLDPSEYISAQQFGGQLRRKFDVEQIHYAAMPRSFRMMGFVGLGLRSGVKGWPALKEQPALNEMSLGSCEGRSKEAVFGPNSVILKGLVAEGADYRYPGISAAGVPGESTRDVVRRIADYLIGIRAQPIPPKTILALSYQIPIHSLFGFVQLGGFEPGQTIDNVDAHELQNARLSQPTIDYYTCSSLILEGTADAFNCRIEHVGQPPQAAAGQRHSFGADGRQRSQP